jgi:nucleoside-diphosphate kinase
MNVFKKIGSAFAVALMVFSVTAIADDGEKSSQEQSSVAATNPDDANKGNEKSDKEQSKTERTLCMIKPDAVKNHKDKEIEDMIKAAGFKVVAEKEITMTQEQAEEFYKEHKDRPFFKTLVALMTSGPIKAKVLEKENAVKDYRKLMGATDSAKAEKDTIRGKFGTDKTANAVHGSDSPESAEREIKFFFKDGEIAN